jgi:hypothetical protein
VPVYIAVDGVVALVVGIAIQAVGIENKLVGERLWRLLIPLCAGQPETINAAAPRSHGRVLLLKPADDGTG